MKTIKRSEFEIVHSIPPKFTKGTKVAIDTEFSGIPEGKIHRPTGNFVCATFYAGSDIVYMVTDTKDLQQAMDNCNDATQIFANAIFDLRQIRRWANVPDRKKLVDILLIEKIMFSGYYDQFALNDLARRYCGIYLDKGQQKSFIDVQTKLVDVDCHLTMNTKGELCHTHSFEKCLNAKEVIAFYEKYGDGTIDEVDIMYNWLYMEFMENVSMFETFCCDVPVDKFIISEEQEFYAAADAVATWMVWDEQKKIVSDTDYKLWTDVELPYMWTLLDIDGIGIDVDLWNVIVSEKDAIANEIFDTLTEKLGINIRSTQQLLAYLQTERKLKIKSTGKAELEKFATDEIVAEILKYRKPAKASSTYGEKWLEKFIEPDGKVYASTSQIGSKTGRPATTSPNLSNIPVRDEPRYRDCFVAQLGKKLLIVDYSTQEPRILAFLSQDKKLIEIFQSGEDLYIEVGFHIFGEKFGKKDVRRSEMKSLVLGLSYGMQAKSLGEKLGKDRDYAQDLIDKFFQVFPGVKKYINDQISSMKNNGYVINALGRKIYGSTYSGRLDQEASNFPIQSSASEMLKVASTELRRIWKQRHQTNPCRLFVYDELVVEVLEEEVEEMKELLEQVLVSSAENIHKGIPSRVEIYSGDTWGAKH